jgi:hypothetical protein
MPTWLWSCITALVWESWSNVNHELWWVLWKGSSSKIRGELPIRRVVDVWFLIANLTVWFWICSHIAVDLKDRALNIMRNYLHSLPISILSNLLGLPVQPGCYPVRHDDAIEMYIDMHSMHRIRHLSEIRCHRCDARADKMTAPSDCELCQTKLRVRPHPICACCLQSASQMCSACKSVHFCSKTCQRTHWKTHKPICREIIRLGMGNVSTRFGQYLPS